MSGDQRVVFVDTNVLINLGHVNRLDLLDLLEFQFVVPTQVREEVKREAQRRKLEEALSAGWLEEDDIHEIEILVSYAKLKRTVGDGEAACLALAEGRGGWVATSDRKRKFLREVDARIGRKRVLNLAGLFVFAIRRGLITVEQADGYKSTLAERRFLLPFDTFAKKV